jgi:hypothetical protein
MFYQALTIMELSHCLAVSSFTVVETYHIPCIQLGKGFRPQVLQFHRRSAYKRVLRIQRLEKSQVAVTLVQMACSTTTMHGHTMFPETPNGLFSLLYLVCGHATTRSFMLIKCQVYLLHISRSQPISFQNHLSFLRKAAHSLLYHQFLN